MAVTDRQETVVMPIGSQWQHYYEVLKGYILSNPDIRIGPCELCIPENLRGRFYDYFDSVRGAIAESWNAFFCLDVHTLSRRFIESEEELLAAFNIAIELPLDLASFLHNPKEGMMRLIYGRLFDLVQGKIAEDDFERIVETDLAANATAMFRLAYEAWAALTLIFLLEPDHIWGVALDNVQKPIVAEIGEIAFGRQFHHPAKRLPEFLIRSKKLNSYVAFKMPLTREVNSYYVPVEFPTQRLLRNRNGDTSSALDRRMIFLSVVPNLKDTPVFADLHERTINSPDLTIEFLLEQDISDSEIIAQIQNRVEIMKPRRGGVMVRINPSAGPLSAKVSEAIDTAAVGLDQSGFHAIIDKLV